jgi:hypothetical protein
MIDVTINNNHVSFTLSVVGLVEGNLIESEVVDDSMLHLNLDGVVRGVNIHQFTFNGIKFDTSDDAVNYIQNL